MVGVKENVAKGLKMNGNNLKDVNEQIAWGDLVRVGEEGDDSPGVEPVVVEIEEQSGQES